MDNDTQQGLQPQNSGRDAIKERVYTPVEHDRHYTPLNRELHAEDARQFGWVAEAGSVQSYQHQGTHRHIHIDGPSGQFMTSRRILSPSTPPGWRDGIGKPSRACT